MQTNVSQYSLLQKQNEILDLLKRSELEKADKDVRLQFWETYEVVAEEVDTEFLERYNGDIDIIPTFVRFLPHNSLQTILIKCNFAGGSLFSCHHLLHNRVAA